VINGGMNLGLGKEGICGHVDGRLVMVGSGNFGILCGCGGGGGFVGGRDSLGGFGVGFC